MALSFLTLPGLFALVGEHRTVRCLPV